MTAVFWFRNDLRLHDNPGLEAAVKTGKTVVPVYILDDLTPKNWKQGGATRWWLHHSLIALDAALQKNGFGPLVLLQGDPEKELDTLMKKIGDAEIFWNRRYEPWATKLDAKLKEKYDAESFATYLLFEPWQIKNKTGGQYKVFTPFSKACLENEHMIATADAKPVKSKAAPHTIKGLPIKDLGLMPKIKWYTDMEKDWQPGEAGALKRLAHTLEDVAGHYKEQRDFPAIDGVSRLSAHLHFGEISPRHIWHATKAVAGKTGGKYKQNSDGFLRQLIWRDFSWYLLYHDPEFPDREWNPQFRRFPWREDEKLLALWQKGQTGYPIVDAGMRQLWQTGWMHNRVRMIVGSFLVKNLLIDWRRGEEWFWDTLVDADLGNNAAGWQWIAGCGADAAPYFRIFNPILQSKKFDPDGEYIKTYVPELRDCPAEFIHAPWDAPPMLMASLKGKYPSPIVDHYMARDRAMEAYRSMKPAAA